MLKKVNNHYIDRSEEIDSVLGKTPNRLIKWGISLIFFSVGIVFLGSYFFKIPETIKSEVIIFSANSPSKIIAQSSGKIERFLVEDGQFVEKGTLLLIIENSANFKNVEKVKLILDSCKSFTTTLKLNKYYKYTNIPGLGEIQVEFSNFIKIYEDCYFHLNNEYLEKKINNIENQILNHKNFQKQLLTQKKIFKKQLKIQRDQFEIDSILYTKGIISLSEFKQDKKKLLTELYLYEGLTSNIINNEIQISKLEFQNLEVLNNSRSSLANMQNQLLESFKNLKASIKFWEKSFVVRAPIDGVISSTSIWSSNQYITKNQEILTIVPYQKPKLIGKVLLPMQGVGKVKIKQKVNIRFDGYPYAEYGIVKGQIKSISLVPVKQENGSGYIAEVEFLNGLTTNYGFELEFKQEMLGSAEIIIDDTRLVMKLFNPLKSIFYENLK